jgi:7-cyano-7-deazaguanine synthase
MKSVVIVSGGMDSITLLHDLVKQYGKKNIEAISFLYGSRHMGKEIPMAKYNCEKLGVKHQVIDVRQAFKDFKSSLLNKKDSEKIPEGHYKAKTMKSTVVPFRNGILLSIAAGYADSVGAKVIFYGAHTGDHAIYPDCRTAFVKRISEAIQLGTYGRIGIKAPYEKISKIEILKKGIKLGVDYGKTWTCYNPTKGKACGKCGACQERLEAFKRNNVKDPLKYVSN